MVGKGPLTSPTNRRMLEIGRMQGEVPMIEVVRFRSQPRGCMRTAFPLAMAALSLFLLLVSTEISQACANSHKATMRTNAAIAVMQASSERIVEKLPKSVGRAASVAVSGTSKVRTSKCCDAPSGHCGGDACSKGCCATCAPAVLASSDDFTLMQISCAYVDRQRPAAFYRIPSPTFRPPRTIV